MPTRTRETYENGQLVGTETFEVPEPPPDPDQELAGALTEAVKDEPEGSVARKIVDALLGNLSPGQAGRAAARRNNGSN